MQIPVDHIVGKSTLVRVMAWCSKILTITSANDDQDLRCNVASQRHNKWTKISIGWEGFYNRELSWYRICGLASQATSNVVGSDDKADTITIHGLQCGITDDKLKSISCQQIIRILRQCPPNYISNGPPILQREKGGRKATASVCLSIHSSAHDTTLYILSFMNKYTHLQL